MKERITPKDDIETYNAVTNENTDKTQVLKWALCGKDYEDLEEQGLIVRLPYKVKQDKDGFFYYTEPLDEIDKKLGLKPKKIYLAFVQTVCEDFKETYCYGEDTKEFYDRHFTDNDDTVEIKLIKAEKKLKELKGEE